MSHRNRSAHPPTRPRRLRWWATLGVLVAGVALLTACTPGKLSTASELARAAQAYTARPEHPTQRILVVGDSTAVGTGADAPKDSLVGRMGTDHPQWHIDNLAANGARFADVAEQLERASGAYDLVLVLAGGNDVIRFTREATLRQQMADTVRLARARARHVVLMPCGNVGHAPFFLPPLSWIMSQRSQTLHALAQEAATAPGVRYVKLLQPREQDPFVARSAELHADDGLHPSSAGYRQWYQELREQGGLTPLLDTGTSAKLAQ